MSHIITPPTYITIDDPLIFLAGPIQGAQDWQEYATAYLHKQVPTAWIASPRRKDNSWTYQFDQQVDWETYHLRRAGKNGVILFWLAKEAEHFCERAYAQTTRFELSEWKLRHERDGAKIALGIEEGFSGAKYIKRRMMQDCPDVRICSTLEETCDSALSMIKKCK